MHHIQHHKKQAKLYLRWHRERYHPVAAVISQTLPRFCDMSDEDVLNATFRLVDAQELVARTLGYGSWAELATGITTMESRAANQTSVIIASEPQLFVTDMDAALAFYTGMLGFKLAFAHGQPPFYAQVVRDAGRLNLRVVTGPVFDTQFRERERDVLCATMALNEAKPLFIEYENAGVMFHQRLRSEPWGARTFIVRDPDGNLLAFAGG